MAHFEDFERQLGQKLATAEHARRQHARETEVAMAALEGDQATFTRLAGVLDRRVIQPRVRALAARFDGAHVEYGRTTPVGVHARCTFARTDRFPAAVTLTVGVLHDRDKRVASVFYGVDIIPVLFQFEKGAHLDLPLDDANETAAEAWVEEKLLAFLETYLRLEGDPNYQRANLHVDPVCGMQVSAGQVGHRSEHTGRTYYFCSQACHDKFVADPDFFVAQRAAAVQG